MASTKQLIGRLSSNTIYLSLISSIGLVLSLYTIYVEIKFQNNHNYHALCDINSFISCTSVFSSKYGKGLGLLPSDSLFNVANPVYGVLFYTFQLIVANVAHSNRLITQFYIFNAIIVNISSIYLGFVMAFIIRQICLVCISTYIINLLMLIFGVSRYRIISNFKRHKKD